MDGAFDSMFRAAALPIWLTLIAAVAFAVLFFVTLTRGERSVANGALGIMTLLAIAIALTGPLSAPPPLQEPRAAPVAAVPALSCIDEMAGETALVACEKVLFSAPDIAAAAVSYAAAQLKRLIALTQAAGGVDEAEIAALRAAVERDRYGLIAHVLATRERCEANACAAFALLSDPGRIAANIDEKLYDTLIARYAPAWGAGAGAGAQAALPGLPTGRPSTIDFPTSASIPPINIMTDQPSRAPAVPQQQPAAPAAPVVAAPDEIPAARPPRRAAVPKSRPAAPVPAATPVPIAPAPSTASRSTAD